MKCPHCLENFHEKWDEGNFGSDETSFWSSRYCICPSCRRIVIQLMEQKNGTSRVILRWAYPKGISRSPIPEEVDDPVVVSDYQEACLVLADSSKASAALSRRCLQRILREKAKVQPADLSDEIQEVIDTNKLPTDLADNLDYIRNVGNFAAHPIKSKNSGEVVDVEPGEAEWNLDVLEELIDFYFVRPARAKKKREALNSKLKDAGKPELPI